MKIHSTVTLVAAVFLFLTSLTGIPARLGATTLGGRDMPPTAGSDASSKAAILTKNGTVAKYISSCRTKPPKEGDCDKIRKDAIEILTEDVHTLGSSAQRIYMPALVDVFKSEEIPLRIAAADAIGMIGPQDSDADFLAPLTNDPVPDVRRAVSQMISRGKGNAISLLGQRTMSMQAGLTPDTPVDPKKFAMPVAPESTYLFYASDAPSGRLSYLAKGMDGTMAFFKGKAKKGPFPLQDFKDKYRYQFQDEDEAMNLAREAEGKEIENMQPPDPSNLQAYTEFMQKVASVGAKQGSRMYLDSYEPKLFGSPTVYVLEERQIGKRSYPTRYVVLYQDQALKKPGYRLSWMTTSDDAIRTVQTTSLAQEKEELANEAQSQAVKKKQAELDALTRKKDDQQKKEFKKGQADLEKELGF